MSLGAGFLGAAAAGAAPRAIAGVALLRAAAAFTRHVAGRTVFAGLDDQDILYQIHLLLLNQDYNGIDL